MGCHLQQCRNGGCRQSEVLIGAQKHTKEGNVSHVTSQNHTLTTGSASCPAWFSDWQLHVSDFLSSNKDFQNSWVSCLAGTGFFIAKTLFQARHNSEMILD